MAAAADIEVVAEAGDGREAIDVARTRRPYVVLLDIRMPALDGLSTAAELRRVLPELTVIMLTTFPRTSTSRRRWSSVSAGSC